MAANIPIISNFTAYWDMYDFERSFNHYEFHAWMSKNWTDCFWYCIVYVIMVFVGRWYMSSRPRFELRLPLITWSSTLAVFSIFASIRTVPELIYMIKHRGFEGSICEPYNLKGPMEYWAYIFTMSKLYELGDTAFIILRKQPLIFLHWYHHVTVFIYVWYSYIECTAPGRWFMTMNYTVHSIMYTYYALRAMKFRIPKLINKVITTLQIVQMLMGVLVMIVAGYAKHQGRPCQQSKENMIYCGLMYISYIFLFAYYFYSAYLKPNGQAEKPPTVVTSNGTVNSRNMNHDSGKDTKLE